MALDIQQLTDLAAALDTAIANVTTTSEDERQAELARRSAEQAENAARKDFHDFLKANGINEDD